MARRKSSGVVAAWAEAQRRQQRQREARERALVAWQREQERAQRAAERAHARDQREAWRAYQQKGEEQAAVKTQEIEARTAELANVLVRSLAAPPFRLEQLKRRATTPPFSAGPLGVPVVMPNQISYQVAPPSGMRSLSPAARREYQEACQRAQAQFEHDSQAAREMQELRWQQLAAYHQQYTAWADRERRSVLDHNAQIDDLAARLCKEPEAIRDFFTAALYASQGWPEEFPRSVRAAWNAPGRHLIIDWELPRFDVVPAIARYRYIKSDDREAEITRPAAERKALYRHLLAQCGLRVLTEAFRSDVGGLISSVVLNGFVIGVDPATGRNTEVFLLTVMAEREALARLDLAKVDPVSCLAGLKGQMSSRPEKMVPVHPTRLAAASGLEMSDKDGQADIALVDMDPIDFEDLVAVLFREMGFEVMTTERTGDGGVDVRAMDPDPIRGGKLVIQVKRYRSTIPPAPVRDLYGTMLHEGAIKGILVSTAEFGPGAQEFAAGKPLALIGGSQLADLLSRHGIVGEAPQPRGRHAAPAVQA